MIKVKEVKYGLMPYSAGIGQSAIGIYFEDDGEHYNFEGLDEAKDSDTFQKMYADTAEKMYADIKALVEKNGIKDKWDAGLAFEKGIYTLFIGDVCVDDEYFYPYNMLLNLISKESIERQQMSDEFIKARAEKRMPRLNPPRFGLVSSPRNPMITKNPYEACNFIISLLKVRDGKVIISDNNQEDFYHINSIANINNHPFGTFVFRPAEKSDLDLFDKFYSELPFRHKLQIYVVPKTDDEAFKTECYNWALDHDYRVGAQLNSVLTLDFDD